MNARSLWNSDKSFEGARGIFASISRAFSKRVLDLGLTQTPTLKQLNSDSESDSNSISIVEASIGAH